MNVYDALVCKVFTVLLCSLFHFATNKLLHTCLHDGLLMFVKFYVLFIIFQPDLVSKNEKKRLKICFTKNVSSEKATGSSSASNYAGTSNLNVREETEFSTSNYDSKSHAGTDLTTVSDENTAVNANEEVSFIILTQQERKKKKK